MFVEQKTLHGHKGPVNGVAFSRNGEVVASRSYDKTIKLWNVASGMLIRSIKTHASCVRFSPDSGIIAAGTVSGSIKLWSVSDGSLLQNLKGLFRGHSGAVNSVRFNHDGTYIASGGYDETIKLWNVRHGGLMFTIREPLIERIQDSAWGSFWDLVFSRDGSCIISADKKLTTDVGYSVRKWRRIDGKPLVKTKLYDEIVRMGKRAADFVSRKIKGKKVRLEFDEQEKDQYGRLLAYVDVYHCPPGCSVFNMPYGYKKYEDGLYINLNAFIVYNGYAASMTIPPNVRYDDLFKLMYKSALVNKRGLWLEHPNPGKAQPISPTDSSD